MSPWVLSLLDSHIYTHAHTYSVCHLLWTFRDFFRTCLLFNVVVVVFVHVDKKWSHTQTHTAALLILCLSEYRERGGGGGEWNDDGEMNALIDLFLWCSLLLLLLPPSPLFAYSLYCSAFYCFLPSLFLLHSDRTWVAKTLPNIGKRLPWPLLPPVQTRTSLFGSFSPSRFSLLV